MFASKHATGLDRFTTFGDLLKYLRRRAGLTQRQFSINVGYSDSQISRLELNQRVPDRPMILARFVPALQLEAEPEMVSRLLELAAAGVGTRLLAVVGASGSGKSSVVRAGLIPALRRAGWGISLLTPTAQPLSALAVGAGESRLGAMDFKRQLVERRAHGLMVHAQPFGQAGLGDLGLAVRAAPEFLALPLIQQQVHGVGEQGFAVLRQGAAAPGVQGRHESQQERALGELAQAGAAPDGGAQGGHPAADVVRRQAPGLAHEGVPVLDETVDLGRAKGRQHHLRKTGQLPGLVLVGVGAAGGEHAHLRKGRRELLDRRLHLLPPLAGLRHLVQAVKQQQAGEVLESLGQLGGDELPQRVAADRRGQGYSLTYLGHALAGLGEWGAAAEAYDEAYRLRQELGQRSLAIDDLAGLAGAALAQEGDAALARRRADEIVAWLDANGPGGIEYPLQVYWMCYRVLSAAVDGETAAAGRARALLDRAHGLLMEQAAQVRDPGLRRKLLDAIATNREIIAAWEQAPNP